MTTREGSDSPSEPFGRRRQAVFEALGEGAMVLPAAPRQLSSRDTERIYVPDRELYYLTAATEPETLAVLIGGDDPRWELFVRDRDPDAELWTGPRLGVEGSAERFAPRACHPVTELAERLPALLSPADRIFFRLGRGDQVERLVVAALARARARGARTGDGPRAVVDPGEMLDEARLIKDVEEVARLRRAAAITVAGQRAGAASLAPGVGEWEVEAAVEAAFRSAGAAGPGFETIVGAGENGCVLHYVANDTTVKPGDLVLVDAGAEFELYHGDVTRTYPADGHFSDPQRDVYEIVERARAAAVAAVRPGVTIGAVHEAAVAVVVDGLVALGVLDGSVSEIIEAAAYKAYFPHQTSHWLGLDVHDPGDYARRGASRTLEPGMVFTVEPGLYFPRSGGDSPFEGIGVRIEDDVLVGETGAVVLSEGLPTSAEDVEALVGLGL